MPLRDREARLAYGRAQYAKHRDRMLAASNARYAERGDEIKAQRAVWRTPEVRAANAATMRDAHKALRAEMIEVYGGKCRCCGEAEPAFLELDHVNDDGAHVRRQIGRGSHTTYRKLKVAGWPKADHRLLCSNCNQGRARNGGVCPHEAGGRNDG